ncbi:MAG: signal peptide peptidase SppA [Bacteroidaceae bacterium]|nr:signal peptide peptidase SppA [Bacteroidaceae bacterium]MBR6129835.1 signal peptide peptidase SppA [Bacteroidaceae bacterium]
MKDFLKYVLATIVGIILTSIIFVVISIVSLAGMLASEGTTGSVSKNSVLRIKLQGEVVDRAGETSPLELFSRGEQMTIALDQTLDALKKAAKNDKVKGIYLEAGPFAAYPADLQEMRRALLEFKESGKWIVAYGDQYSRGAYYLCSVADEIFLNPIGAIDWSGMSSQPMFYTGLLKKVGVKMQVFKVGTYKSAVEPFINTEMSEANREQTLSYLSSIWNGMLKDVAASRRLKVDALNSIADSTTVFCEANVMIENKLADKLGYLSDVKEALRQRLELEEDDELKFTNLADVAAADDLGKKVDDEVAVYYAYGEINDREAMGFTQEHQITTQATIKDLQKLRKDKDVKAVVIRVNSPGGSAFASEQIWHEVQLLRAEKPVVVSMGGLAASGGYYISCGANEIWAEPMTLTGSIGIFGMIPDPSELLTQKLGLSFDVVKTNAMSDFGAMGRPFNAAESAKLQNYINHGYDLFTGRVAGGRGMAQDSVKVIAEGRVWTGEQAQKIGLVDKLGNLDDAIASAAKLAEVEDYTIGHYPAPEPWYESIFDEGTDDYMEAKIRAALGEYYTAFSLVRRVGKMDPIQARMPFDPNIK